MQSGSASGDAVAGNTLEHSKYWAFISYSHADSAHAEWLHKSIEQFRVPRRLVGRPGRDGPIPRRLFPLFRDQDELAASGSLSEQLQAALHSARTLIVICSPASAKSRWVEEEIRLYKSLGRADRILGLVVDGKPNVSAGKPAAEQECFPTALRFVVDAKGELTDQVTEPLAANLTGGAAARQAAKLQLIAGMLNISFDELKQRERQRQRQRFAVGALAAAVFAFIVGGTWYVQEAKRTRDLISQTIVSLTNLGQRELAEGRSQRAAAALAEAYRLGGTEMRMRQLLATSVDQMRLRAPDPENSAGVWSRIVLDPKGQRLVGLSRANAPRLWDAASGKRVADLPGHQGLVNAAAFTADGAQLMTVGDDRTLRFWDATTGKPQGVYTKHASILNDLVLSADGQSVATLGADRSVFIWSVRGRDGRPLAGDRRGVLTPARFSADGRRFAGVESMDLDAVWVWNLRTNAAPVRIKLEQQKVGDLTFTPTGNLAIGDTSGLVRVFNSDTGARIDTGVSSGFFSDAGALAHISFLADNRRMLVVSRQGVIQLWDFVSGRKLREHQTGLPSVKVANVSGSWVVLETTDSIRQVSVWDAESGTQVAVDLDGTTFSSAAIEGRGKVLFTAGEGLAKWRLDGPARNVALPVGGSRANVLDFSPDGRRLILGDNGATATIWDSENGSLLQTLPAFDTHVGFARFYANGTRILTQAGKQIRIFDGQTFAFRAALSENHQFTAIEPSPALPPTAALVYHQAGILLWVERDDGRIDTTHLPQPMGRVSALRFSADGKLLAVGRDDGTVEMFDVTKRARIWSAWRHDRAVRSLAFTSDNARLLSAGGDAYAIVWSVNGGSEIFRTARHGGAISGAAFSSDGRRIVTASEDQTAKIWDGDSGRLIVSLDGHGARVTDAAFAPQANLVATIGADGFSRLWDADTGRMVHSLKHPGELLAMQFSPRGDLLATASSQAAAAYLRSVRLETRPAAAVLAEIASGSRWKVENEVLVDTRQRAGGDVRDEQVPSPAALQDARNQPDQVASAFLTALEQANREVLASLLASVASSGLRSNVLQASAEELKALGALSAVRRMISTVIRDDKVAALTTYEVKGGSVGVWTVNERGLWKVRELNSRSAAAIP